MLINKKLSRSVLPAIFLILSGAVFSQSKITNITLSSNSAMTCDSIVVTIQGEHYCPNDSITGISHYVSGSDIFIAVGISSGFCIPPTVYPTFTTTYTLPLTSISTGSYTVKGIYNTTTASVTKALSVTNCCPAQPNAGSDTAFCDNSTLQLNGNVPPMGTTAKVSPECHGLLPSCH